MATTATLYPSPQLPPGTSVGAYKASGWPQAQLPPSGAAVPSADATATVASDGSLAFTGLTDSTDYYAGASVSSVWRYVAFNTYAASREGDQHVTVDSIAAGSNTVGSVNQGTSPWLVSENAATIPTATTMQNAATGNGNGTTLDVSGYAAAVLSVVSSVAMSGGTTVNFEVSADDTTWVSIAGHQIGVKGSLVTTTTVDGLFRFQTAGIKSIRARISGYSAGTVTITGRRAPLAASATAVVDAPASALTDQRKTVTTAGTAVQLLTSATPCVWVAVTALKSNTDVVAVGSSTVLAAAGTARGVQLNAMEKAAIPIDDVSKLWVDSRVNGEGVSFLYGL